MSRQEGDVSRAPTKTDLTADYVRSIFDYDPETGIFTRSMSSSRMPGKRAGWKANTGYRRLRIGKKEYLEHRVAWLVMNGTWPEEIDHINGDPADNRICNLRIATRSQNCANRRVSARSKSGIKGVSQRDSGTWTSRIKLGDKDLHLGNFSTAEDALAAYAEIAKKHFGEFAAVSFKEPA
jgi:hypothetical protein